MFTAVAHKKLANAKEYFQEHLSQNDYYAAGEIQPAQWIGRGVEPLRLTEQVTSEAFCALCENKHPETGERLTQRTQKEGQRRVFYDFTCSAPKSVSVLAVTLNDQRLMDAHAEAARIAFRELENFAVTRVRKPGNQKDRTTGNLVAAAFTHDSSRALDPQLHTHFAVFNATFDSQEKRWKALEARGLYDAIRYGTAVYRNELAKRVQQIGYRIVPAKHGFEIEGVPAEVLKRFSKRSQQRDAVIKEMEAKLGRKLTNNEVSHAVHQSRAKKVKGILTAEVRERQLSELSAEERQSLEKLTASVQPPRQPRIAMMENKVLDHAIEHVFERKSVVPEHEVLDAALSHRPGEVDLERLKGALKHLPDLVRTERGLTTKQILATELSLIQTVNAGCDSVDPLHPGYRPADWMGEDQRRASYHVLRTTDRITGLKGLAGTGKTTALKELLAACQEAKVELLFCAPTAAATDVLRKEGFEAKTFQSLLLSKAPLAGNKLIVLDEAGAVGMDDMQRLFELAKNNRIVLSGDTGQHASVARGDALRILERHSRFQSGQLTAIRRQRKAEYRKAVELAAQKRTTEAFGQLERMAAIIEVHGHLHEVVAKSYLNAITANKSVLLVAPTWNEIEAVTEKVRAELKTSGRLTGEEKEFQVFDSSSWTTAQKRDVRQYRIGMEIHFRRAVRGFKKGESVSVFAVEKGSLKVQRADGSKVVFPLGQGSALCDVGEKRSLKVTAGDKLLLQANAVVGRKQFVNGELVEVKRLAGESIVLTDGRIIPVDYRTFAHGYAVTSHASQGKTVDEVLLVASARSLPAVNQEQFYVSISRGRERCQVFTDDKDLLRSHVTDSSARLAAIEAGTIQMNFFQSILQRGNRFLKWFHQRIQQSLVPDKEQLSQTIETPRYEQRKSTGIGI
jgi:conjugative relaxase-like TrwC/TraI family protein